MKISEKLKKKITSKLVMSLVVILSMSLGIIGLYRYSHGSHARLSYGQRLVEKQRTYLQKLTLFYTKWNGQKNFTSKNFRIDLAGFKVNLFRIQETDRQLLALTDQGFFMEESVGQLYSAHSPYVIHAVKQGSSFSEDPENRKDLMEQGLVDIEVILNRLSYHVTNLVEVKERANYSLDVFLLLGILVLLLFSISSYYSVFKPVLFAYIKQVDERVKKDLLLRDTQQQFFVGNWEYDPNTNSTKWSDEVFRIFGYVDLNKPSFEEEMEIFHKDSRSDLENFLTIALNKKKIVSVELQLKTWDGKNRWVLFTGSAIHSGKLGNKVVCTVRDITEKVTAKRRFNSIFSNSTIPYLLVDDNKIIDCNLSAVRLFEGEDREDFLNLPLAILSPINQIDGTPSVSKLRDIFSSSNKKGDEHLDWTFKTMGGNKDILAEIQVTPIEYGENIYHLISCQDKGQHSELEKKLVQVNIKAQAAMRSRAELMATFGNEILEPLTEILASMEGMEEDSFTSFRQQASDIIELVENVVTLSKKDGGVFKSEYFSFNLSQQINAVLKFLEPRILKKNLEFKFQEDPQLDNIFWGDPSKIRNILFTILHNSMSYTERGGIILKVKYEKGRKEQARIKFVIMDTGVGIPENKQDQIFHSHSLADNLRQENKGGSLPLIKRFIEAMNGHIKFASHPGKGSKFEFFIVLDEEKQTMDQGESSLEMNPQVTNKRREMLLDFSMIKDQYKGSETILMNVIEDYLEYCPMALKEIETAIENKDSLGLEIAASSLYGVLGHFNVDELIEMVIELEKMGQFSHFDHAMSSFKSFEKLIEDFNDNLRRISFHDLVA